MAGEKKRYFQEYNGWRGLGIIFVVMTQLAFMYFTPEGDTASAALFTVFSRGTFAIDILFILSGFLITHTFLARQHLTTGTVDSLKCFYERRALRILPPCFIYLMSVFVLGSIGFFEKNDFEFVSSALFFRNYLTRPDSEAGWLTAHLWTLSVEEHFYLFFPLLFVLVGRTRAIVLIPIVAVLIGVWRIVDGNAQFGSIYFGFEEFWGRTDIRADALMWGVWTNLMYHSEKGRTVLEKLSRTWFWYLFFTSLLICIGAGHYIFPSLSVVMFFTNWLFAIVMVGTVVNQELHINWFLNARVIHWFARISYSLYIWKNLFLSGVTAEQGSWLSVLQVWPYNIGSTILAGAIGYYLVEHPMNLLSNRISKRYSSIE